ncbi:MAG: hypothetical protein ABR508_06130 [Candidatus Baltobacteraceae bacterium]
MHSAPPFNVTVLIYAAVIGLFIYRMARPQRMSVVRLAIMPIFLVALTALSVWGGAAAASRLGAVPAPAWEVGAALLAGALAGIPLGWVRGRHSEVRATEKRGVIDVRSSPLIVLVWLVAFGLRALVRYLAPHSGPAASLAGDGVLAFAVSALIVSYVIIYQRYTALTAVAAA